MPTWREIEARAAAFSKEWSDATYERGEAQTFYNEFFCIFGIRRRSVARFEEHVRRIDGAGGFIDLFWPGVLLVEHKSEGGDLERAAQQAGEYFDALPEGEKPRYQLVCDFQTFELKDRETGITLQFQLADLHRNVHQFGFIMGRQAPVRLAQEPLSREATARISAIYRSLVASGYPGNDLEKLLTRIVFCLFADNTGIFQPRGHFSDLIESRTSEDGADLGPWLANIFQVLNTPPERRQRTLDHDLANLTYIDGGLFADAIAIAACNQAVRDDLLAACRFDWAEVSPSIFGALFQSVLSDPERRALGGHFTSEANILKVCSGLFLHKLEGDLAEVLAPRAGQVEALRAFQRKLRSMRFLDPACGCGNFLVVAYRELRSIELQVVQKLVQLGAADARSPDLFVVDVDQFSGIEFRSYSARIAETAMWMTDHIANNKASITLGIDYFRIPLARTSRIQEGDALNLDWRAIEAPGEGLFVLGNPPYGGAKYQTEQHRRQVRDIARLGGQGGTLDYVCGWLIKAAEYAAAGASVGFVAVNSVIQGEQVGQLWPILFERYQVELAFAHKDFLWDSTGPRDPRVQVVILGLVHASRLPASCRLYTYPDVDGDPLLRECGRISPYLVPGDNLGNHRLVVRETPRPINGLGRLRTGSKPIDGGYYILSEDEKNELVEAEPAAARFIRPFVGGAEFLAGNFRHILVLGDAEPNELRALPRVMRIVDQVRRYRRGEIRSKDGPRRLEMPNPLWETPLKFHLTVIPKAPYLVVPEVTSERRSYVPIAWLNPPVVPSNLVKVLMDADLKTFALLTSAMHMAWLRGVGGRLEGRLRYSIGLVFNTFPIPQEADWNPLNEAARSVLDARKAHPGAALEDLYDPAAMPGGLRAAHEALDSLVDRIYFGRAAPNDEARIEHLLGRYERMIGG